MEQIKRKLKLQVQMSVDGFVGGPNGDLDWMTWDWDDNIKSYVTELTDSIDTILLGRKMTDGFVTHWTNVTKNPDDPGYSFAKKMINAPKVVFSKTINKSKWENTLVANGEMSDEIGKLKNQQGKDIIVYGGASFVSSLLKENLIDEYYLFVNPAAIGRGLSIFKNLDKKQNLTLIKSIPFSCGIVLLCYAPVKS
jgi:dihydrofolate reductase